MKQKIFTRKTFSRMFACLLVLSLSIGSVWYQPKEADAMHDEYWGADVEINSLVKSVTLPTLAFRNLDSRASDYGAEASSNDEGYCYNLSKSLNGISMNAFESTGGYYDGTVAFNAKYNDYELADIVSDDQTLKSGFNEVPYTVIAKKTSDSGNVKYKKEKMTYRFFFDDSSEFYIENTLTDDGVSAGTVDWAVTKNGTLIIHGNDAKLEPFMNVAPWFTETIYISGESTNVKKLIKNVVFTGTFRNSSSLDYWFTTESNIPSNFSCPDSSNETRESLEPLPQDNTGLPNLEHVVNLPSNIISMNGTFIGCSKLKDVGPLSKLYFLQGIEGAFISCTSLNQDITLSETKIENLAATFAGCTSLEGTIDLSNCKIIDNLNYTFYHCANLKEPPILDGCDIEEMDHTFCHCLSLIDIPDLTKQPNLYNIRSAFSYCRNIEKDIIILNEKLEYYSDAFSYMGKYCSLHYINDNVPVDELLNKSYLTKGLNLSKSYEITKSPTIRYATYMEPIQDDEIIPGEIKTYFGETLTGTWTANQAVPDKVGPDNRITLTFVPDNPSYGNIETAIDVYAQPQNVKAPDSFEMEYRYGEPLSNLKIPENQLRGVADEEVTGTYKIFANNNHGEQKFTELKDVAIQYPPLGSYTYRVQYRPDSPTLSETDFEITVHIVKNPTTITQVPTCSAITYGQPLRESTISQGSVCTTVSGESIELEGTFRWKDGEKKLDAGTHWETVVFAPEDKNYDEKELPIAVCVNPGVPELTKTSQLTCFTSDNTLGNVSLDTISAQYKVPNGSNTLVNGTFEWKDKTEKLEAGQKEYIATFIPEDTTNFTIVEMSVPIKVYASLGGNTDKEDTSDKKEEGENQNTEKNDSNTTTQTPTNKPSADENNIVAAPNPTSYLPVLKSEEKQTTLPSLQLSVKRTKQYYEFTYPNQGGLKYYEIQVSTDKKFKKAKTIKIPAVTTKKVKKNRNVKATIVKNNKKITYLGLNQIKSLTKKLTKNKKTKTFYIRLKYQLSGGSKKWSKSYKIKI